MLPKVEGKVSFSDDFVVETQPPRPCHENSQSVLLRSNREQHFRRGVLEFSGNFLPGAQETNWHLRAEDEIPQLDPAEFLIAVREDQIVWLQRGKGAILGEQRGGLVSRVQHEVNMRIRQARKLIPQGPQSLCVAGFHSRQIDEHKFRPVLRLCPETFDGCAEHFTMDRQIIRRVRAAAVQSEDANGAFFHQGCQREPFA